MRAYVATTYVFVARAVVERQPDRAAVLLGSSRRIALSTLPEFDLLPLPSHESSREDFLSVIRHETVAAVETALGRDRRRALQHDGDAIDDERAVEYALETIARARADLDGPSMGRLTEEVS